MVSVILPVFNAEKYLKEAIDSILSQSYKDYEFIIINDGSIDKTEEIILSYNDTRIKYVKNEKNLKLITTLNKGIDMARGEYVVRMDADDIALPNMILDGVNAFKKHPDAVLINQRDYVMSEDGKSYWKRYFFKYVGPESLRCTQIFRTQILHPGIIIRTDILKAYKYRNLPETLHREDFDLWRRILRDGHRVGVEPNYVILHRLAEGSITSVRHEVDEGIKRTLKQDIKEDGGYISDDVVEYMTTGKILSAFISNHAYFEILNYFMIMTEKHCMSSASKKELKEWLGITLFIMSAKGMKSFIGSINMITLLCRRPYILTYSLIWRSVIDFLLRKKYSRNI